MKCRILLFAMLATLVGLNIAAGSCTSPKFVRNKCQAAFTGLSGTNTLVNGQIWTFGKGLNDAANTCSVLGTCSVPPNNCTDLETDPVGCDYGATTTLAANAGVGCVLSGSRMLNQSTNCNDGNTGCVGSLFGANNYLVNINFNTFPLVDGCPNNLAGTDREVVLADDNTGKFGVISRTSDGSDWSNLDAVAQQAVVSLPTPIITSAASLAGTWTVDIRWTALTDAAAKGGFAAADDPGTCIIGNESGCMIRGYAIYVFSGAAPPASLVKNSLGWTPVANICTGIGCVPAPGNIVNNHGRSSARVTFADGGTSEFIGIALLTDSGFQTIHTGAVSAATSPTAITPVITDMSATVGSGAQILVKWTSGDEKDVKSYSVGYSLTANGTFNSLAKVAAVGSPHSYQQTVSVPAGIGNFYIRIKINKTTGAVWSDPVNVNRVR